jgi:hypothetical protein
MQKEEKLRKSVHKLLLLTLKVIPIITSVCYLLNTLLSYIGIDFPVLSHISGMSLFTWVFIFIATIVFKFCIYHRMFLYYILINDILNIIDYYIGIPITTSNLIMLHLTIAGVFLFLILYLYVKYNQKSVSR